MTEGARWRSLGASVVGTSHIRRNLPCQDAHAWKLLTEDTVIAVVADGAGSADRAQEGSQAAVERVINFLSEQLPLLEVASEAALSALLPQVLAAAREALEKLAEGTGLHQLATTLLLAIVSQAWLATAQVGDGGIVAEFDLENLRVLTVAGSSEYLNETHFITSADYLKHAHYSIVPAGSLTSIALFSDGIQPLALRYADNSAHRPFFKPLFDFAFSLASTQAELEEFLSSKRVCDQTDDDKTLLLAVRSDLLRP